MCGVVGGKFFYDSELLGSSSDHSLMKHGPCSVASIQNESVRVTSGLRILVYFHGDELSSSELVSCLTLYLLRTGSEAVADIRKDLAEPTIVLSCILPTSLHT